MGVRQIRYCDLSGGEEDVESHVLQIDQMRVEIDLAAAEYRTLLEVLGPYIEAGRVEASAPDGGRPVAGERAGKAAEGQRSGAASGRVPALTSRERQQLRQWAEAKGMDVPVNNRFKRSLIEQWRQETRDDPSVQGVIPGTAIA